jgi:Tfp pilus assembly protein PilN
MIEITLLPGARKKSKSSRTASLNLGAILGTLSERFKDPWLIVAIVGVVVGLAGVAGQYVYQSRTEAALGEQQRVAVQDSARYAAVLTQRRAAESQRDSILRQIAVIRAIDGDRFVWPHVLDEISRALPTYTWLSSVLQSSAATTVTPEMAAAGTAPRLGIRVSAYTADIQAVTIFMRQLEASPFFENITLGSTEVAVADGKEVTQFQVTMTYSKPDSSAIRTVPLSIAVR